jgi:competence protein ComGC
MHAYLGLAMDGKVMVMVVMMMVMMMMMLLLLLLTAAATTWHGNCRVHACSACVSGV